jgi:hypothetical protein
MIAAAELYFGTGHADGTGVQVYISAEWQVSEQVHLLHVDM